MTSSEFKPLSRSFYNSNTVSVAKRLLGKLIIRKLNGRIIAGKIVETEAYTSGEHDPASHAYRGMTKRNEVMFGKNGISYVYFTYGMYFMFNIVAKNKTEDAGAVLIRALEPIKGIKTMKLNRQIQRQFFSRTNGNIHNRIIAIRPLVVWIALARCQSIHNAINSVQSFNNFSKDGVLII